MREIEVMISPVTINKILSTAKIEEVVADYVALKKRGVNYVGLCPFHNEKTPSFTVSPTKNIYKCFGCGASGNVVKFVMDHEKLSYPDALRLLAKKYNIYIEEIEETEEIKQQKSEREKLLEVLQFAQQYFTHVLHHTEEGKQIGLKYLVNERKIDFSLIQKFQLGYSPQNKKSFCTLALQSGFSAEILYKAGLINYPDYEEGKEIDIHKIYDKFFGRVIFPITDISGKIIGFGGRILVDDGHSAKYINSPQTPVYDKSQTLYGLHLAKKSIVQNDLCYLVEGYADVISLHKAGIENVVASSGTSLTTQQVKLIHRFTSHVVVLYDGDYAGIKASIRAIDMLLEEGLQVKILLFPEGDDPDSFVNKYSAQEVHSFLKNHAKDFIEFKKELYQSTMQTPTQKAEMIEELLTSVAKIPNEIHRRVYIQYLSNDWKIDEGTLLRHVQKIRQNLYHKKDASVKDESKVHSQIDLNEHIQTTPVLYPTEVEEKNLIKHLIKYGNVVLNTQAIVDGNMQKIDITVCEYIVLCELKDDELSFDIPVHQLILEEIKRCLNENFIPDENYFIHHSNPEISEVSIKYVEDYKLSPNWSNKFNIHVPHPIENIEQAIPYLVRAFKEKKLRFLLQEKHKALQKAEAEKNEEEAKLILKEIQKLEEIKQDINNKLGRRTLVI